MKMNLLYCVIFSVLFTATSFDAAAEYSCSFDLRKGVAVSRDHIRLLDEDRTVVQINEARQLIVEGKLIKLEQEQQDLLYAYARGIHDVVPEVTLIAKEGVGLVVDNITRIYSGLVGKKASSATQLNDSMKKVKSAVREKFGRSSNYYYINPGKLEDEEEEIPSSLEEQIESGFSNVSGILTAVGTFDNRTETEDNSVLRFRARIACDKLHKINKIEAKLNEQVIALKRHDIIIDRNLEN